MIAEASVAARLVRMRLTNERDLTQLRKRLGLFLDKWHIKCASEDVMESGHAILEAEWERRWPKRPRWLEAQSRPVVHLACTRRREQQSRLTTGATTASQGRRSRVEAKGAPPRGRGERHAVCHAADAK
jgi:hypothetical protein